MPSFSSMCLTARASSEVKVKHGSALVVFQCSMAGSRGQYIPIYICLPLIIVIRQFKHILQALHFRPCLDPRNNQQYQSAGGQQFLSMQGHAPITDQILLQQIPKLQFSLNNDELVNCMKEINFGLKTQQNKLDKLKNDVEKKPSIEEISQSLALVNSVIEIDPALAKLLKTKDAAKQPSKSTSESSMALASTARSLGHRINQISEMVTLLNTSLKALDKRVGEFQYTSKASLNQKCNALQEQIDDNYSKINASLAEIRQRQEIDQATAGDRVREVETRTLWQINDCKMRLNSCINEQYVRDAVKELEGKIHTKMKEELIRQGSIQPERISRIESAITKNEKDFQAQLTEVNYKIQKLKQHVETTLLTKKQFGDDRIELEKRFNIFNTNIADAIRRIRHTEGEFTEVKTKLKQFQDFSEASAKQTHRMNEVLKNLKIGDDFQKMLEKMDPHKICELDDRVNDLSLHRERMAKLIELTKLQVDRLRSKTQFVNVLSPNKQTTSNKMSKQQIDNHIHEYFSNNLFAKKIQTLESQIVDAKGFPEMVNEINKKLARFQKETDTHNIVYELRGLQEYVKKEILIVNNRINNLESTINEDRKRRPVSAGKTNFSDQKITSSVSTKKLIPMSCISCFPSPGSGRDKASSLIRKF